MVKPTTEVNKKELTNCNTLPTGTCVWGMGRGVGEGGTLLLSMQFVQVQFVRVQFVQVQFVQVQFVQVQFVQVQLVQVQFIQ
jgi:hypothetical protein